MCVLLHYIVEIKLRYTIYIYHSQAENPQLLRHSNLKLVAVYHSVQKLAIHTIGELIEENVHSFFFVPKNTSLPEQPEFGLYAHKTSPRLQIRAGQPNSSCASRMSKRPCFTFQIPLKILNVEIDRAQCNHSYCTVHKTRQAKPSRSKRYARLKLAPLQDCGNLNNISNETFSHKILQGFLLTCAENRKLLLQAAL